MVYRINVFLLLISRVVAFIIFVLLWSAIYRQGSRIGDYSLAELVSYYALVGFIGFIVQGVDVAWRVGDQIRLGEVTNYILRPVNYLWSVISTVLGKSFFNLMIALFLGVCFALFKPSLALEFLGQFDRNIFFAISLVFSFSIFVFFFYIIGMLTFWLGTAQGLSFLIQMIMYFLAGSIIPLNLLPKTLIAVNDFLPFKYIVWFPIQIFTGKVALDPSIFFPAMIWAVVLYFLAVIIYKKGTERYEGFGA